MAIPIDTSCLNVDCLRYVYNDVIAAETLLKEFKNEKEKKEMANVKMCDLCETVYSTKKADKTWDDTLEDYGVYIKVCDYKNCDSIEICPDCYKAITDKLVELGLKAIEKDDKKEDD